MNDPTLVFGHWDSLHLWLYLKHIHHESLFSEQWERIKDQDRKHGTEGV